MGGVWAGSCRSASGQEAGTNKSLDFSYLSAFLPLLNEAAWLVAIPFMFWSPSLRPKGAEEEGTGREKDEGRRLRKWASLFLSRILSRN